MIRGHRHDNHRVLTLRDGHINRYLGGWKVFYIDAELVNTARQTVSFHSTEDETSPEGFDFQVILGILPFVCVSEFLHPKNGAGTLGNESQFASPGPRVIFRVDDNAKVGVDFRHGPQSVAFNKSDR